MWVFRCRPPWLPACTPYGLELDGSRSSKGREQALQEVASCSSAAYARQAPLLLGQAMPPEALQEEPPGGHTWEGSTPILQGRAGLTPRLPEVVGRLDQQLGCHFLAQELCPPSGPRAL
eukprot:4610678-Lingulodinium_polyedra.AAC.1